MGCLDADVRKFLRGRHSLFPLTKHLNMKFAWSPIHLQSCKVFYFTLIAVLILAVMSEANEL